MFRSVRSKLIVSFLGISFLVGAVSLLVGGQLLYNTFLHEAHNRIRQDLNAAQQMYHEQSQHVRVALDITVLGAGFRRALADRDTNDLVERLNRLAQHARLDFAGIADGTGKPVCRIGPDSFPTESTAANPLTTQTLKNGEAVSGTVVLSEAFLQQENSTLAARAKIKLVPTPMAAPRPDGEETSGMAYGAAIPVFDGNVLLGVLYGGTLLNRSHLLVDTVRNTVFHNETFHGRDIGTATVFLKDIRISTNVQTPDGERALGTRASSEVAEKVLKEGKPWVGRAFVVSDWYISAYEPIQDIFGERVGMFYVGVLEAPYADIRTKAIAIFVVLSLLGISVAIGLGYLLERKIMRPVHLLVKAADQVSNGDLSPDMGPMPDNELGGLQRTFMSMLDSIKERESRQRAESESRLVQSQKQASIGRLAAGVAHEINNPLTGVLAFTHMMLRREDLPEDVLSDLKTVVEATERVRRIVKGLLDFSRQTELDREPTEVNELISSTLMLLENQAVIKGVNLNFEPAKGLPLVTLDRSQLRSVLINLIINALDATSTGGRINLSSGISFSVGRDGRKVTGVQIAVTDTGSGIPAADLPKLFEPFFTTKEVGKGTGLGLSVSYGIISRHGGTIQVQSEVGQGSTFTIWLPTEDQNGKEEDTSR